MTDDRGLAPRLMMLIAIITILSGIGQAILPGVVLSLVGAESDGTSRHFFGIIGMFMALFGGALVHALRVPAGRRIVVLWATLQKLGASVAVGLGVAKGIFSPLALGVAGFDLLSFMVGLWYWRQLPR